MLILLALIATAVLTFAILRTDRRESVEVRRDRAALDYANRKLGR